MFHLWYSLGCPTIKELHEHMKPDVRGRVPHVDQVSAWSRDYRWGERKDELLAKASQMIEDELVLKTFEMWKRHADQAEKIGKDAFQKLITDGWDTSSSALQGLKWAQEEERRTRGVEVFYKKVKDSTDDELVAMIKQLAERQASTEEDVVDAPTEDAEP